MLNIVLFGPPGAGKGTQSKKLRTKYNLIHISTGDLFRKHIKQETPIGLQVEEHISEGRLVPDEITLHVIEEKIAAYHKDCKGFLFDGFPRTLNQSTELDKKLAKYNTEISFVLSLDVPRSELYKRIKQRGIEENRVDDQDESSILTRFDVYNSETLPLEAYYEKKNKFIKVSGSNSIDSIFNDITNIIDNYKTKNHV